MCTAASTNNSLFLRLVKNPYWDSSRPWHTPKKKQNGVKVHNVSKYPRWYWFSQPIFIFPQKSFTDVSSFHRNHVADSSASSYPCIPPAASCGATVEPMPSRCIILGFSFLCGCAPPGQPAVLTGNRWTTQKFESAHQVILFYDVLCNWVSLFTSFSNSQRLQSWFYYVCIFHLYSAVLFALMGRKSIQLNFS